MAPTDPVQQEEEKEEVVSIWERLLAQNHKSKETKTYKKSGFAKIMKLYEEKRDFTLQKFDEIKSLDLKQQTENIDLPGDSHKLCLIYSEFAVFFARYSPVIFKHELMFTAIPFRDECFIIMDLLDIAREVSELEATCREIISLMLNQTPHMLDLPQLTELVRDFTTSLYLVDYCPSKMDSERFLRRLMQFSEISQEVGKFLALFAANWYPTWEELGIAHYLPCEQVNARIRLSHWLAELSCHYRKLEDEVGERRVFCVSLFEELGISRDSEFATKDGSLRLLHPDTYAGQESFEFLFED
jgi:hypothetical protein